MKTFKNLIEETEQVQNIDELESAGDIFQYGLDKGIYTLSQSKQFNELYWNIKNKLMTIDLYNSAKFKDINYLQLLSIVTGAKGNIKDNKDELEQYIRNRISALKKKQKIA